MPSWEIKIAPPATPINDPFTYSTLVNKFPRFGPGLRQCQSSSGPPARLRKVVVRIVAEARTASFCIDPIVELRAFYICRDTPVTVGPIANRGYGRLPVGATPAAVTLRFYELAR